MTYIAPRLHKCPECGFEVAYSESYVPRHVLFEYVNDVNDGDGFFGRMFCPACLSRFLKGEISAVPVLVYVKESQDG